MSRFSRPGRFGLLCLAALAAVILGIGVGSVPISPVEILQVLANKLWGAALPDQMNSVIPGLVWSIRLPRVLLAFCVGASLAVSGAVMQSLLQNPLASSYGLGVSSGAGLGAAVLIVTGVADSAAGTFLLPAVCLCCGLATMGGALAISTRLDRNLSNNTIILIGMVLSLFLNAIMTTLSTANPDYTQRITLWQLGSLSMKTWKQLGPVALAALVCILAFWRLASELDLLSFGEEQASAMGLERKRVKWILVLLVALLTGTAVAFVGVIGFVDLVAPHIVRRIFGPSHRMLIPACAIFGGGFLSLCDLAARTLASPSEIPIGSITALIGAPFFLYIFFSSRKEAR